MYLASVPVFGLLRLPARRSGSGWSEQSIALTGVDLPLCRGCHRTTGAPSNVSVAVLDHYPGLQPDHDRQERRVLGSDPTVYCVNGRLQCAHRGGHVSDDKGNRVTEKGHWISKDGRRIFIPDDGGSSKGRGGILAMAAAVVIASGAGVATGIGALGGASVEAGADSAAGALAGNTAGDVVDSLPGRSITTRRASARESAKRGKSDEALGKLKLKRLKHRAEHELECVTSSTGKVREFLARTPCASLDRMLMAVGDGHGNAAVISVVRVGFRTRKEAKAFEKVERVQGSGDIRPLEIAQCWASPACTSPDTTTNPDQTTTP